MGKEYGVFKEKGILAKVGLGMERSTFVIDKECNLVKEYRDVKVKDHADDVYRFIKNHM